MKFIYSLMLFTFLMSTFSPVTGWGAGYGLASVKKTPEVVKVPIKSTSIQNGGKTSGTKYGTTCNADCGCPGKAACPKVTAASSDSKPKRTSTQIIKAPTTKAPATKAPATKAPEETTQTANTPSTNTNTTLLHCSDPKYAVGACFCNSNETKPPPENTTNGVVQKCIASVTPPTPQPPSDEVDNSCLAVYQRLVVTCNQDADSAVNKCNSNSEENKSNSDFSGLDEMLKGASAFAVKSKAGSGAYEACLNTALTTQAGFFAADKLNTTSCQPAIDQCKTSCETVKNQLQTNRETIAENCVEQEMNKLVSEEGQFETQAEQKQYTNNSRAAFHQGLDIIIGRLEEGSVNCTENAVNYQNEIKQTTNDFNNAAKQAQVCRCQTGSTGEDCNAIKGPAECALNPNAVGCAMSTINCNNSDSLQCRCTRNPNLAECKSGNSGPSAFANANGGFKPTTSNGVSPKIKGNDFDISFDEESNLTSVSGTPGGVTSPFGSAEAGGSGGGSGGAGAVGEEDPAAVAEGEGGLKHLLDKAKGYVGGLFGNKPFGSGNANDKKYGKDGNGKKIDPSKWRPGMLRGVAGDGSEIGPKHRDIWKQMNSQYFLQEKTFLQEK